MPTIELTINPILLSIFVLLNILAFFFVLIDKSKAVAGNRRIPEVNFFLFGIFLGSIGIITGMYTFRHKIRKWYFVFGFGFLAIQNIITLNYISNILDKL